MTKMTKISWVWDVVINERTGDVKVTLTERFGESSRDVSGRFDFEFKEAEIVSYLKSHCAHNVFAQCPYEGKLKGERVELEDELKREGTILRSTSYGTELVVPTGSAAEEKIRTVAFYYALDRVFKTSAMYDHYYGGGGFGHEAGFNFSEWLRNHAGW